MVDFLAALDERVDEILDACTRCGKCLEVCPSASAAKIDKSDAGAVVGGVLDVLRSGDGPAASLRWAEVCTGSGACIPACPEAINPRFMLAMARARRERALSPAPAMHKAGIGHFQRMSRGVRVLSRMQLAPDLLHRIGQTMDSEDGPADPEIIFYTGCNILKTPHIALLCLDVLDALGVRYRVYGGPANCCGVMQLRGADVATAGKVAYNTIDRFAATGAGEVVAWCPSCMVQFGDIMLPNYERTSGARPFDMTMFVCWLADRLDALRPLLVHRVEKRVALHEHPGVPGVGAAARRIIEAIPGVTFVDVPQPAIGSMCNTLSILPEHKRAVHLTQLETAEAADVTTLAGVYHACHRELCSHERDWPFEVVNFLELVGASMGISHPDLFKRLKLMQDIDTILAESSDMIAAYELDVEEARAIVLRDMLGEQALPLGRGGRAAE
ncbi:MAG: (Fe-S)-binding protein [Alphaproteobacteria bacterium]|nr:(Fe-S)-binding protein [Alphaproteobacteria bacterium]